jgi:uncharacterized membrane protein
VSENARFCPVCGTSTADRGASATADAGAAVATAADRGSAGAAYIDGLPENIAGMLAYFFVPAIVFLCARPFKTNRFVRFHSFQCIATVAVLLVVHLLLAMIARLLPLLILPLFGLVVLAEFTLWLLLVVKAYQHEIFKLPIIGEAAASFARNN